MLFIFTFSLFVVLLTVAHSMYDSNRNAEAWNHGICEVCKQKELKYTNVIIHEDVGTFYQYVCENCDHVQQFSRKMDK